MKRYVLLLTILTLYSVACGQVQLALPNGATAPNSVIVTLNPPTIAVGTTSLPTAKLQMSDLSTNVIQTFQCNWSSSNNAVATIAQGPAVPTPIITAVAAGTASIGCALLNGFSGSATLTVLAAPIISNPTCASQPCVITGGIQNSAYVGFTFQQSGGTGCTWSVTSGSFQAGLSLSSAGVLSGTPTVASTVTPTVQVSCTSGGSPATVQVSLTVSANSGGGPPTYALSTTSQSNPGTITALFSSTSPTATTCSGQCQNATAYDTTLNPSGIDCVTRLTDGASVPNGKSIANVTATGGDNDLIWSRDEKYVILFNTGGGGEVLQLTTSGNCWQVVNTGLPTIVGIAGGVAFDYTTAGSANIYFNLVSNHILKSCPIVNVNTLPVCTQLFDYTAAGSCPGLPNPFAASWNGEFVPANGPNNSQRFTVAIGTGGQGSAYWVVSYDTKLGCSAINMNSGQVWSWCSSTCGPSTTPLGTVSTASPNCFGASTTSPQGIHGGQASWDGTTYRMSESDGFPWSQGVCAGNTAASQDIAWQIGTLNTFYTNGQKNGTAKCPSGINCEYNSHPSEGVSHALGDGGSGYNTRPVSNYSGAFTYVANDLIQIVAAAGGTGPQDQHATWIHPNFDDTFPVYLGASDAMLATTGSVTSPPYMSNVVFGLPINGTNNLPKQFCHTYSCGQIGAAYAHCPDGSDDSTEFGSQDSIGSASPQGHGIIWGSTMLHSLGTDNAGVKREDAFIVFAQ